MDEEGTIMKLTKQDKTAIIIVGVPLLLASIYAIWMNAYDFIYAFVYMGAACVGTILLFTLVDKYRARKQKEE
jgi:hypothetical protein